MGLSLSIEQSNYQNTSNQISQISNEECINYVTDGTEIIVNIDGGTYGNIEINDIALLNSPSCILKASLDSDLINKLSSKQNADITDIAGLFTALDALARIGGGDDISQDNYQNIMNEATQQMNSLCLNYTESSKPIILSLEDAKVRNLVVNKTAESSKSNCVIDNMSKMYISNDESNDQTAKITRFGIGMILALAALILALGFVFHHHRKHGLGDQNDSEKISFGSDDTSELAGALLNNNQAQATAN